MAHVYVTRRIPQAGLDLLTKAGLEVDINQEDRVLSQEELITALSAKPYQAVLCLLTDTINQAVFKAAPEAKIFANYAVGFDNIDLAAAKQQGIAVTNTPDVLTDSVAEHTFALLLSAAKRLAEADRFTRAGRFKGWAPMLMLGVDLKGQTLGIVGLGRIGSRLAEYAACFGLKVIYYDLNRNEDFEAKTGAEFKAAVDDLLPAADFVSLHVPLTDTTRHLINADRLKLMKSTAILINTARGPIIDESALVAALKIGTIRAAALDVFEHEPELTAGLAELDNVTLTPHIASGTETARSAMAEIAAQNIIAVLAGQAPLTPVKQ